MPTIINIQISTWENQHMARNWICYSNCIGPSRESCILGIIALLDTTKILIQIFVLGYAGCKQLPAPCLWAMFLILWKNTGIRSLWIYILSLPVTSSVILGKWLTNLYLGFLTCKMGNQYSNHENLGKWEVIITENLSQFSLCKKRCYKSDKKDINYVAYHNIYILMH